MSEFIEISGSNRLDGEVRISGAKNSALPILIASLLSPEPCVFRNVPNLHDVHLTLRLLEHFGTSFEFSGDMIRVHTPELRATEASYSLVKSLRASFWVLGPLLARGGAARVALPGGDIIGARPVDIHLEALRQMGADIQVKHGVVFATAEDGLKAADIHFRFPSVGATHQILMAASLTEGVTTIRGAAREPEVVDLGKFLQSLGVRVEGLGSSEIIIEGRSLLEGADHEFIGDRIETATYLLAGVAAGGRVRALRTDPEHLRALLDLLVHMGVEVETGSNWIEVRREGPFRGIHVATGPFPELATDIQAPLMAALCFAEGESVIEETIFEGRFGHVSELCRMGANIKVDGRKAYISGPAKTSGALVEARDIRAGAALVITALASEGVTAIHEPQHLRRGYSWLEEKVQGIGGTIGQKMSDPEDYVFTGC